MNTENDQKELTEEDLAEVERQREHEENVRAALHARSEFFGSLAMAPLQVRSLTIIVYPDSTLDMRSFGLSYWEMKGLLHSTLDQVAEREKETREDHQFSQPPTNQKPF